MGIIKKVQNSISLLEAHMNNNNIPFKISRRIMEKLKPLS